MDQDRRERAYRFVAFSAVSFSLVAIVAVFITLPIVNNYINSVHARVQSEMEFCKLSARDVMMEVAEYRALPRSLLPGFVHAANETRHKRQTSQGTCQGRSHDLPSIFL
ncbi:nematode cuticle collagen domain protein [Necator americanus]|uniref:Nematode cuticle collagen domain protein n=1 Tax=Necator americanus TaxID=51031 RepID=W2SSQ1_NECAM|nr:nematode cuticle collagen domain protein [Necator americanus]ETN71866.1 nematode cuticle collagen domain protein [Necator americanus]